MNEYAFTRIYSQDLRETIAGLVEVEDVAYNRKTLLDVPAWQKDRVEVIFSGWGAPAFDKAMLDTFPNLKAIFYGAGSVKAIITDEVWNRGILVTSAYVANSIPVAEYTFAQIVLALKKTWQQAAYLRQTGHWERLSSVPGAYHSTHIGVISLGAVGSRVCERLRSLDVNVYGYDPYVSKEEMERFGARKAELAELFKTCDVVTLHAPLLEETHGIITEAHLRSMAEGATFINTARGALVDEPGMIRVLQDRPDLFAILDVTHPEPPLPDSPLYQLPNVLVTPHISGSLGGEYHRMGRLAVEECKRYLAGEPALYAIVEANFHCLA